MESTDALLKLAMDSHAAGDFLSARNLYSKVLQLDSKNSLALGWLGTLEAFFANYVEAERLLHLAVESDKANPDFLMNYANVLNETGRYQRALLNYSKLLEKIPPNSFVWSNIAACHNELRKFDLGLSSAEKALSLDSKVAATWINCGNSLSGLGRKLDSLACYRKAAQIEPLDPKNWIACAIALTHLDQYKESLEAYKTAFQLGPDSDKYVVNFLHTKNQICAWDDIEHLKAKVLAQISSNKPIADCGPLLSWIDSPEIQKNAISQYLLEKISTFEPLVLLATSQKHSRIRLGYFSADFREHPVSYLTAELFELHDRSRFEVFGFMLEKSVNDPMRTRLQKAFDQFLDVSDMSDTEMAQLARRFEIDIAVDLTGHTKGSRPSIFVYRVAPIQVSYLGYPGTWGHKCMDYIIGDHVVVTPENAGHFSEKVIYMPESFQVNDRKRGISHRSFSRAECGLPEKGFVFCCFNNNWKFNSETFDSWVRILKSVPESFFWFYAENQSAAENLKKEAVARDLNPERLIAAPKLTYEEYLARFRLADLFLDTLPYNAGTTASDALWAGLPVLTLQGKTFCARMASSLLHAVGLPELITHSRGEYEALAVKLATTPQKLADIRARLLNNLSKAPLFDTQRFTNHLESAYQEIMDRYRSGLESASIVVTKKD